MSNSYRWTPPDDGFAALREFRLEFLRPDGAVEFRRRAWRGADDSTWCVHVDENVESEDADDAIWRLAHVATSLSLMSRNLPDMNRGDALHLMAWMNAHCALKLTVSDLAARDGHTVAWPPAVDPVFHAVLDYDSNVRRIFAPRVRRGIERTLDQRTRA